MLFLFDLLYKTLKDNRADVHNEKLEASNICQFCLNMVNWCFLRLGSRIVCPISVLKVKCTYFL